MWLRMGEVVGAWLQELSQASVWKSFQLRKCCIGSFPCNFLISLNSVYTSEGGEREREREMRERDESRNPAEMRTFGEFLDCNFPYWLIEGGGEEGVDPLYKCNDE